MTEQSKRRGNYNPRTPEFKAATVARLAAGERLCDLEKELGVRRSVIHRWRARLEKYGPEVAFRRSGPPVASLKAENEKLKQEVAALKAASN